MKPPGRFDWIGLVPFFLKTGEDPKLNFSRIVEAVIIAIIAGALSGYISVAKLEVRVENLCAENSRQEKRIDDNLSRLEKLSDSLTDHISDKRGNK